MNTAIDQGLSEFMQATEVRRNGEAAEIIIDYFHGDETKPVRLIGFKTNASKSDYEILEEGFYYYNRLKEEITKRK